MTQAINLIVAVDGSEMSMTALHYVTDGLMQLDREIFVEVLHIFDESKDYLPVSCRQDALKQTCEMMMISSATKHRYQMTWVPKRGPGTTSDQLCEAIRSLPADYVCLGYNGLKGKKDYFDVLGSKLSTNVFAALNQGNRCSVVCIKDEKRDALTLQGRKAIYAVSVNLSKSSSKAFLDVLRLSKPGDEIHLVYSTRPEGGYVWQPTDRDYVAEVMAKYESFIAHIRGDHLDLSPHSDSTMARYRDRLITFTKVIRGPEETIPQAVVRHAEEINADFLVVGANVADRVGRGKIPVGTASLEMCMLTDRNFMIAKWLDVSEQVYASTVMSTRPPS